MSKSPPNGSDDGDEKLDSSNRETNPKNGIVADADENALEEEEYNADGEEEGDEGHILDASLISTGTVEEEVPATEIASSGERLSKKCAVRRKKSKPKGKKNLQANQEKLHALTSALKPIPFIPHRLHDFSKHEKLFRKLGLWDFVHVDFDRNIQVHLIAQLVLTYKPKIRASYVNDFRIMVNRADLARAFNIPLKKEKLSSGGSVELDLDSEEVMSDDSISFVVEFVNEWLLLHGDDTWMMPIEVMDWLNTIKDGHPEKVDWASLFWFMVERELRKGINLTKCYYASHLQHLIKVQRGELLQNNEPSPVRMELESSFKEEDEADQKPIDECPEHEKDASIGPSTELTLGQDGKEEDMDIMYGETCKDDAELTIEEENEVEEEEDEEEQGQWLLDRKDTIQEHYLQQCSTEFQTFDGRDEDDEVEDEEMDEEEEEDGFRPFRQEDALEEDEFPGNILQASQMELPSHSIDIGTDLQQISGKRVMEDAVFHHPEGNKRLRINDSWDHSQMDSGTYLEKIQQMAESAKKCIQEEKERALQQSNVNQQILLSELQKRDNVIEHLHKTRMEDVQKKDGEIYRLERELFLMSGILDGYRRSLRDTQKAFAEYRERARLPEESTYKDAGPGGIMLTAAELEKLRRKQQEEFRSTVEEKVKQDEEEYVNRFSGCYEKIEQLNKRLEGVQVAYEELVCIHSGRKSSAAAAAAAAAAVIEEAVETVRIQEFESESREGMLPAEAESTIGEEEEEEEEMDGSGMAMAEN